jgi:hypothetical protein
LQKVFLSKNLLLRENQWVSDEEQNVFLTQKQIKNTIYKYPFNSIADTLQRMIFYTTAIETNKENQYFISTHSPYLLSNLIESTELDELNIFLTYYDKYETKVKALSSDEIQSLVEKDIDIFFNMDRFIKNV